MFKSLINLNLNLNNVSSFEEALKPYVTPPKYIDLSQLTGNSSRGWGGWKMG